MEEHIEEHIEEQKAFVIDSRDNVATALTPIEPGTVALLGDAPSKAVSAVDSIPTGHKIALCPVSAGDSIVKYGVVIGHATQAIAQGQWVHLHVMASNYDERSSHLDVKTGAPKDIRYE